MTAQKVNFVILLFLFFLLIPFVSSFNVCNVEVSEINAFIVKENQSNKDILIVDSEGDMYFEGRDHSLNNVNSEKSFVLDSVSLYFNLVTSKFGNFFPNQTSIPASNALVVQTTSGVNVASFSNIGIYTKGKGIYNGSQAGCNADGIYCNVDTLETRDYFCSLSGTKSGICSYQVSSSENCLSKLSVDSDSSNTNYDVVGTVTDYTLCSGSSCTFNSYVDSCSSSTVLIEYGVSGTSYTTSNYDCSSRNYNYCSGTNVYQTNNLCGSGKCNVGSSTLVQSCIASATNYGSWSCKDINTKTRTNIVYSPSCSSGSCISNYNPTSTPEDVGCGVGNYCSGSSCNTITYSWYQSGFGGCSLSCGGGTQSQTVSCKRDYDGAVVSDSYCSGIKPATSQSCNTQSCCTPSCPLASNVCSGRVDTSANGCGGVCNVVGTKTCGYMVLIGGGSWGVSEIYKITSDISTPTCGVYYDYVGPDNKVGTARCPTSGPGSGLGSYCRSGYRNWRGWQCQPDPKISGTYGDTYYASFPAYLG